MYFWGIHVLDVAIIMAYLGLMMYVGKRVSKHIKGQTDFFLAGRKLGRLIQFFLNFGQMTDANGAATTSAFVFGSGIGGIWFGLQTLFITPYYWFMNGWFRRVRLMTMGELFEDRFGGRELATAYAVFALLGAPLVIGTGYLVSARVMEAVMVKPAEQYSPADQKVVGQYGEFKALDQLYASGELPESQRVRHEELQELKRKGGIKPYVSYLNENWFYLVYTLIIGGYIVLGGFEAAALTDAIQGVLIIVFSLIMIPVGLMRVGGFAGLHDKVPPAMFAMFGNASTGEFAWYSVLAILLVSWITIHGLPGNMQVAGSAKDEMAARIGAVTGGFCKRLMLIAWGLSGLLAYALYKDIIVNPETTWGVLSRNLLGPGAIGIMLAGILAANMSTLDAVALQLSALFVRHVYKPLFPAASEKACVAAGRISIVVILLLGVLVAKSAHGVLALIKFMLGTGVTFGAPVVLLFFWRRLTKAAVLMQVGICMVTLFLLPMVLPLFHGISENPELMVKTNAREVEKQVAATASDVENGLAVATGDTMVKTVILPPEGIFFDEVVRVDPYDPSSRLKGRGRFRLELYLLSRAGMDLSNFTSAGLLAATYFYNSLLPFLILILGSLLTRPTDSERLVRFYGKMATPVRADADRDLQELAQTMEHPYRFDNRKLFPGTQWEFKKWTKVDAVGFVLCWMGVFLVLAVLWVVLKLGA
ncbi:MAG: sodium:solute symporter family protein [Kiritimatiellales bacterium]|nr:sodium:solute symporter family protein [Kiritimatiellales bacterium]